MSRIARFAAALTATVAVVVAPTVSFAHVDVEVDGTAVQGGYATVVFTVPNERSDSATASIQIKMPDATPIAFVIPEPLEGWEPSMTSRQLAEPLQLGAIPIGAAVDVVTWTATGGGISGDDAVQLRMLVGPFPLDATVVSFPTVQTYASGEVVRWIEPELAGGAEPELPLPSLTLSPGTGSYAEAPAQLADLLPAIDVVPAGEAPTEQSIVVDPAATPPATTTAAQPIDSSPPTADTSDTPDTAAPGASDTTLEVAGASDVAAADPNTTTDTEKNGSSTAVIIAVVVAVLAALGAGLFINNRRRKDNS